MKVSIYRSKDGWRWRVKGKNGRIVAASSEAFVSAYNARRNLRAVLRAMVQLVTGAT